MEIDLVMFLKFCFAMILYVLFVRACLAIADIAKLLEHLPDRLAERIIKKLREEEKRKQTEQNPPNTSTPEPDA